MVAEADPDPDSPLIVLVVDNTASHVRGDLPPAVREALATAQADAARLAILAVNGTQAQPVITRRVPLDPKPDEDSQAADNAREIAIACVERWSREEQARPTAEGSAILEAVAEAGRQTPERILVVSDGLSNEGTLDFHTVGFDVEPDRLAAALEAEQGLEPRLEGTQILWTGLGQSHVRLPQAVRTNLESAWSAVLEAAGATVEFDPRSAEGAAELADLPPDTVDVPSPTALTLSCGDQITMPSAMLFAPNSDVLQEDADEVLRDAADQLAANPGWTATVSGHTANYGTPAGRLRLSIDRAEVVAAALVRLGAREHQIETHGYGATRPVADESDGDLSAAARNRRVVIEIYPPECA